MAFITLIIHHACGHDAPRGLNGVLQIDRNDEAESWEKKVCPTCFKAQQLKKAQAASVGLPTLTGSPAQVKWAMSLRVTIIKCVDIYIRSKGSPAFMVSDRDAMVAHTEATFWIDNRIGFQAWTKAADEQKALSH